MWNIQYYASCLSALLLHIKPPLMNSSDVVHCLHHKAQCYQHHWFTEDPLKSSKRSSDSDRADTHAHVHVPFLLSGNTMFGLQVPKSSVCLSRSNIPRLSESCIFFLILSFRTERYGGRTGSRPQLTDPAASNNKICFNVLLVVPN